MSESQPVVAVTSCRKYRKEEVKKALDTVWREAGMPPLRGKQVLVKPNILTDSPPEQAVTTHPVVFQCVLELLLDLGAFPKAGDSPAVHTASFTGEVSGLRSVCRTLDIPWVDFLDGSIDAEMDMGKKSIRLPVSRHAAESDIILSVPKMKNHQLMLITGAVKNLFGAVPAFHKSPYHLKYRDRSSFGDFIARLVTVLPPVISVMDGIIAMEGAGPNSGTPRLAGYLLASADPGALDVAASVIMGYDPRIIPACISMHRLGLTKAKTDRDIAFPLLTAKEAALKDFHKVDAYRRSRPLWDMVAPRLFRWFSRPKASVSIDKTRCISCGKCAMICPNGSASGSSTDGYSINRKTCIRCYCCHEICPADAVRIERK